MSCQSNCNQKGLFVCMLCEQLFCLDHGQNHRKEFKHSVELSDEEINSKIHQNQMKKAVKLEKCKRVNQITQATCLAISNLQQIAQMQINLVKKIKNLEDFAVVNFDYEKHLLHLTRFGMIKEGIYYISKEQVSDITISWNQNLEEMEKLRGLIKSIEVAQDKIKSESLNKTIVSDQSRNRINKSRNEKAQGTN